MDINNMDDPRDDETIGAADDVGTKVESAEKADGSLGYDPTVWSKAPRKCPTTGRFLPGTGGSLKGGRPVGAKDKISTKMIEICSELVADKGAEILEHLAKTDPAAAMAICLKVVPNSEWIQAHTEERTGERSGQPVQVNIGVVPSPSPRLSDTRTQAQIDDQQRGLVRPVERLPEPTQDDLRDVIEAAVDVPTEPSEDAVVATQDDANEEAARAERERVRRQNEAMKAHGELVGRRPRSAAPDTLDYPDDPSMI